MKVYVMQEEECSKQKLKLLEKNEIEKEKLLPEAAVAQHKAALAEIEK